MADTRINIVISAASQGVTQAFTKAGKAVRAFNAEVSSGPRMLDSLRTAAVQTVGALAGFAALANVGRMLAEADKAAYNLETSLRAANRQFDVGTLQSWEGTIKRLSTELRVYSDTELRNATSRTIDMTKRLGLSREQMEKVITTTADLSAGKVDLEGGIERVTAALRGEAESAEYLGLTLNEDYVKAWYAANDASGKAWKTLTDLEKAQVRYNLFLEQALPFQGKAAESVNTLSGAYKLMTAQINDSIKKNQDIVEAMKEVAKVFSENGEEIGAFLAQLVGLIAKVVEFIAKNREIITVSGLVVLALVAVTKTVTTLIGVWKGLNAAMLVLSGESFVSYIKQAQVATSVNGILEGSVWSLRTAVASLMGLIGAATIGYAIGSWLNQFEAVRKAAQVAIGEIIIKLKQLQATYYEVKIAAKELYGGDTTADQKKQNAILDEIALYQRVIENIKQYGTEYDKAKKKGTTAHKKVAEAAKESGESQKTTMVQVTDEMKEEYKGYVDEIKRLQGEIADSERSLQAELRDMARSGMSGIGAWKDRKAEADEYFAAAQRAAKAGDLETAREYANLAKEAYKDLNTEVKVNVTELIKLKQAQAKAIRDSGWSKGTYQEYLNLNKQIQSLQDELHKKGNDAQKTAISANEALKTSVDGVKKSGELAIDILEKQKKAAEDARVEADKESGGQLSRMLQDAKEQVDGIKKAIRDDLNKVIRQSGGDWGKVWDEMNRDARRAIDETEQRIVKLTRDREVTLYINEVVKKATGGMIQKFATGGRLAGYGGGDRIPALLEAGEYIIRKEAVAKFGAGIFNALNSLRLPKFATGGPVASPAAAGPAGAGIAIDLTLPSGNTASVWTDRRGYEAMLQEQQRRLRRSSS